MEIEADTLNFISMFKTKESFVNKSKNGRILVSGMGGSGISGLIASALSNHMGNSQIIPWTKYGLPNWITSEDQVICISYSGNTAETLGTQGNATDAPGTQENTTEMLKLLKICLFSQLHCLLGTGKYY